MHVTVLSLVLFVFGSFGSRSSAAVVFLYCFNFSFWIASPRLPKRGSVVLHRFTVCLAHCAPGGEEILICVDQCGGAIDLRRSSGLRPPAFHSEPYTAVVSAL